jgi:hypothetical protein
MHKNGETLNIKFICEVRPSLPRLLVTNSFLYAREVHKKIYCEHTLPVSSLHIKSTQSEATSWDFSILREKFLTGLVEGEEKSQHNLSEVMM